MSGLSDRERYEFRKIFALMTNADLLSLSDTVTNKVISVENVKEATDTILSFTKNAEELLKRRKVYRDLIFKYLAEEGIAMPPNSEKHQLVRRTLELWSSGKVNQSTPAEANATPSISSSEDVDPLVLGHHFCQWFFKLLNSQNSSLSQQPEDWGPQHFWPDVKLHLYAKAGSERMEEFLGAEMVSLRLLDLTSKEHLLFSPNVEPRGLKALMSPHGLVVVAVAGTIHRNNSCLGVFELIFGLIRSPLEKNSWKIKSVHLKIRGQDALSGAEVTAPTLSYNSSELQLLCR